MREGLATYHGMEKVLTLAAVAEEATGVALLVARRSSDGCCSARNLPELPSR